MFNFILFLYLSLPIIAFVYNTHTYAHLAVHFTCVILLLLQYFEIQNLNVFSTTCFPLKIGKLVCTPKQTNGIKFSVWCGCSDSILFGFCCFLFTYDRFGISNNHFKSTHLNRFENICKRKRKQTRSEEKWWKYMVFFLR